LLRVRVQDVIGAASRNIIILRAADAAESRAARGRHVDGAERERCAKGIEAEGEF
jgi:hypothetical protein